MNISKKSTSRSRKRSRPRSVRWAKKLSVVFLKTLLVLCIALGVAACAAELELSRSH